MPEQNPAPRFETFDLLLPLGGSVTLPISGEFIHILRAGGELKMSLDGQSLFGRVGAGMSYRAPAGTQFTSIAFENLGSQAEDVRFAYGVGNFDDRSLLIERAPNFTCFGPAAPGAACPTGYTQMWLAGQTDRRLAIIQSFSGNTGPIWVGSANPFTGGFELMPGERAELATTDEIWVRNDGAATQYVNRCEFTD